MKYIITILVLILVNLLTVAYFENRVENIINDFNFCTDQ